MPGTLKIEQQRWLLALLALATTILFLLMHPYRGLVHDGRLYTFQALSHLRPDLYSSDIFVLFGSQDDFTLFSPLYASMISYLGVEPAAAALTLCSILLFLIATFALARELLTPQQAWIALLLLLLVPAYYGSQNVFYFIEEFVSPRQLAEALTLFCLLAWIKKRRLAGALLAAAAMVVHPLMGLSGVVLLITLDLVLPHWQKLWPLGAIAALATVLGMVGWLPLEHWQFDAEWHHIVMSRLYLSLYNWDSEAWARILTVFVTLTVASVILEDRLRRISIAAIVACGSLLLLAFVGGDLLRLVIIVQAQAWRALWLATVLAILLLPAIYVRGWQDTRLRRCALILLAAAWAAPNATFSFSFATLALIAAVLVPEQEGERYAGPLLFGAWSALSLVVFFTLADAQLSLHDDLNRMGSLPPMFDRALTYSLSGVPPALVLLASGYIALRFRSRSALVAIGSLGLLVLAAIATSSIETWTDVNHMGPARKAFSEWRALIPPGNDVLWTGETSERESGALSTWLLLDRPSFMSRTQASNALFSRAAAIEMYQRSLSLRGLVPFLDPFHSETVPLKQPLRLEPICRNTKVRYLVTKEDLVDAVATPAPRSAGPVLRDYKLYICT